MLAIFALLAWAPLVNLLWPYPYGLYCECIALPLSKLRMIQQVHAALPYTYASF